jgi:glycosyltransferase involved in cell wall biosynthesis
MAKVSVILPTFNERESISDLIFAIQHTLPSPEIIVVDDNSPDGTWQIVRTLAHQHPAVRLIHRTSERGLTSAIQRGIDEATGDVIGWMDCDMSPATLLVLLARIEQGADIAIASRYAPGGKDARGGMPVAFSWVINTAAKVCVDWRSPVRDYTTGFVAARRQVFTNLRLRGDYGEYCIDFLVHAVRQGFRVVEVGYVCESRTVGESKTAPSFWGFIRRGRKYVTTVLRLMGQK